MLSNGYALDPLKERQPRCPYHCDEFICPYRCLLLAESGLAFVAVLLNLSIGLCLGLLETLGLAYKDKDEEGATWSVNVRAKAGCMHVDESGKLLKSWFSLRA